MIRHAKLSDCKKYRYTLSRVWGLGPRRVLWVGCNPSWADADLDDQTVGRMVGFSKSWGYDGLWIVNAFAYITPFPLEMKRAADPIGPDCDKYIEQAVSMRPLVVACWGTNVSAERERALCAMLGKGGSIYCLGKNKDGSPKHPLYLPADLKPIPMWHAARESLPTPNRNDHEILP